MKLKDLLRNIKFENQIRTPLSKRGGPAMFIGVPLYLAILWRQGHSETFVGVQLIFHLVYLYRAISMELLKQPWDYGRAT